MEKNEVYKMRIESRCGNNPLASFLMKSYTSIDLTLRVILSNPNVSTGNLTLVVSLSGISNNIYPRKMYLF